MTNEVIKLYAVKKHQRLVYGVYPHTPIYPQYTLEPIKNLGGLGKIWGPVPPWPQPKTATANFRCTIHT